MGENFQHSGNNIGVEFFFICPFIINVRISFQHLLVMSLPFIVVNLHQKTKLKASGILPVCNMGVWVEIIVGCNLIVIYILCAA
jgi:hypothetical protein